MKFCVAAQVYRTSMRSMPLRPPLAVQTPPTSHDIAESDPGISALQAGAHAEMQNAIAVRMNTRFICVSFLFVVVFANGRERLPRVAADSSSCVTDRPI